MKGTVVYSRADVVNNRGAGVVASAVIAFNHELAKRAEKANSVPSTHLNYKVKDRPTFKVRLTAIYESSGQFGATYIHKFVTVKNEQDASSVNGAIVTWFGSSKLKRDFGEEFWITATIKNFDEFRGEKQTIVNRVVEEDGPKIAKKTRAKKSASITD